MSPNNQIIYSWINIGLHINKSICIGGYVANIHLTKTKVFILLYDDERNTLNLMADKSLSVNITIDSYMIAEVYISYFNNKFEGAIQKITYLSSNKCSVNHRFSFNKEGKHLYRLFYLRQSKIHKLLICRHHFELLLHQYMNKNGFIHFRTPLLSCDQPEGARNFMIPSRLYPNCYYTLPQSPQLFKQCIMYAGFNKYYQIAPCFRDEDSREDRLYGEFYQLDIEVSPIVNEEDIENMVRDLIKHICLAYGYTYKWTRMTYDYAMKYYCTDKPNLNFPYQIIRNNKQYYLYIPGYSKLDRLIRYRLGAEATQKNVPITIDAYKKLVTAYSSFTFHRKHMEVIWLYNFPLYEEVKGKVLFNHNPFSSKRTYDIVINGYEIGSGSIRCVNAKEFIHNIRRTGKSIKYIFKHYSPFIRILSMGVPPHAGYALGLERLMSIIFKCSLYDLSPFPLNPKGYSHLFRYPSLDNNDE